MLGVYFLAFCLATGRAPTIAFKINVGSAYPDYDKQQEDLHSRKFNDDEGFLGSRREGSQVNHSTVRCHDQINTNERCGDAFLTDIEKGSMGSGFLPKPVGYQWRPNVLRERVFSIPASEDRFSVDDSLPLPFRSSSSRKPILKGRARGPSVDSGERVILPEDRPVGPGFPPKPVGYLGKPNVIREQETSEPTLRFLVDDTPPSPSASLRNGFSIKGGVRKPQGGERQRLVERPSLGPGFPTKPVGYLVKPNVSREQVLSTQTPEGLFLEDDIPLLPPPTLKSRPIPKGGLKRPYFHGTEIQRLTKEDAHPVISSPLFYEDLPSLETKESERKEQFSAENEDYEEQNNAYNDSFNELDNPHVVKERPCPEYASSKSKEVDSERTSAHLNEKENRNKSLSKELATTPRRSEKEKEPKSPEQSVEEEGSHYEEEEVKSPDQSVEDEGSHYEEEEIPVLESEEGGGYYSESSEEQVRPYHDESVEEERLNIANSEEDEEPSSEVIPDEERPDPENSNEEQIQPAGPHEEQETPIAEHSGEQAGSLSSEEIPNRQHSLEYNGSNLSHSKEYENSETSHSAEDSLENSQHSEEVNTVEETDLVEKQPQSDDSEENDGIKSLEESDEGPYQPQTAEEGSNDESTEVARKPGSSLENVSEGPPNSEECPEELPPDGYESFEENTPSYEEDQQKPSLEYQDNEKLPDYYDSSDYDNLSPETEYEDIHSKPWQEHDRRPQVVYYGERPPAGPKGQMKDPSSYPDYNDSNFKPPNYEDNKLKQSEESDSSTPSAEHLSSSSEENLSKESDSTEENPDLDKTPQYENNVSKKPVETPVAVVTSTTQSTTKCTGNDETMSTAAPIDLKILKKPLGTAKPKPPQIGDVVTFTRARPFQMPATQVTTSTRKPVTIAALGIMKPGGSIIAKVVSPTLQVLSSTTDSSTKADNAQMEAPVGPSLSPWRTLLAAREATALTYLKPPPFGQAHTWLLRKRREARTE